MLRCFEVNEQDFKVIYVNAIDEDLIKRKTSFTKFPKIISSTYNGKPIYARYNITIAIITVQRNVLLKM
jgi:hypothetical protein